MSVFFLIMTAVIFIPFAEGALLALLLREVYARHPLPLVEPGYVNLWLQAKPEPNPEVVEEQATSAESATGDPTTPEGIAEGTQSPTAEATNENNASSPPETSVFEGTKNAPAGLPVNAVLNSMTAEVSGDVPQDLESRIEETTRIKDGIPQDLNHIKDDLDLDDLNDLEAALPKSKIDFKQEQEPATAPDASEAISPMAKELLGENFDFDALEQQATKSHANLIPTNDTNAEVLAEGTLDIQDDHTGVVQVSSPFLCSDAPQFAELSTPQTILPTFSDDWIQVIEPAESDAEHFSFTEELQPMFVRKKRG